jgi:hypothetical protein
MNGMTHPGRLLLRLDLSEGVVVQRRRHQQQVDARQLHPRLGLCIQGLT